VDNRFPSNITSQHIPQLESLKNYNIPDFILKLVANKCESDLAEKGKLDKKLKSLNNKAIELLYKIFVNCDENESGMYDRYRFYVYVSSMYHKCEVLLDESIQGKSGKTYLIPVAIKENGMYIAVAFNKFAETSVTKQEIKKFHNTVMDLRQGDLGAQLTDATYCSSIGFSDGAVDELENYNMEDSEDSDTKIKFKIASFENRIYSLIKC